MEYKTNAAIVFKGERVGRGELVEMTAEEAAEFDTADITATGAIPREPVEEPVDIPVEEMTAAQLKEKAAEFGLPTSGSKADLLERITLHQAAEEGAITN